MIIVLMALFSFYAVPLTILTFPSVLYIKPVRKNRFARKRILYLSFVLPVFLYFILDFTPLHIPKSFGNLSDLLYLAALINMLNIVFLAQPQYKPILWISLMIMVTFGIYLYAPILPE